MNDALQDSEKIVLEEEVQKTPKTGEEEEPDRASLAAVAREEEKESADDYEAFTMDAIKLYLN